MFTISIYKLYLLYIWKCFSPINQWNRICHDRKFVFKLIEKWFEIALVIYLAVPSMHQSHPTVYSNIVYILRWIVIVSSFVVLCYFFSPTTLQKRKTKIRSICAYISHTLNISWGYMKSMNGYTAEHNYNYALSIQVG